MVTTWFVLTMALAADPTEPARYLGGAKPTPLNAPGPVDERPSVVSCSVETLRTSVGCFFDGKPLAAPENDAARTRQATDNRAAAQLLGEKLCGHRVQAVDTTDKDRLVRLQACIARVKAALPACSLEGKEALLDTESRFSPLGQACYVALAESAQRVSVAAADPEPQPTPDAPKRAFPVMARPSKK
jgi:hypothetical protein